MQILGKKECIPVGCVPSAAVTVGRGGVCPGGYLPGGCLPGPRGCLPGPGGVSARGCLPGGVCPRGAVVSALVHAGIHPLPPREQNHRRLWQHYYVADDINNILAHPSLGLAPSVWEILDPPLNCALRNQFHMSQVGFKSKYWLYCHFVSLISGKNIKI